MKYLVVQTKQIGDVLISTSLCNNLKQHDPAGEVHYLVMDYCAGMAEGNPNIDRLIVIEKARRNEWRYMKDLLLGIRRERYDVVINSQGQMIGLLTCLFSGARLRIGFDSFPWRLGHNRIVRFRHDTEHQGNSTLVDDRFSQAPRPRQGGSQLLSLAQRRGETTGARDPAGRWRRCGH